VYQFGDGKMLYEGEFCGGLFHGRGCLTIANHMKMRAQFIKGQVDTGESVTIEFAHGDRYEGQVNKMLQMHGVGRYEKRDRVKATRIEGIFHYGKPTNQISLE
jgi:hypothetical protein